MRNLRRRLLDVLPTSTYHLDRFLHLGDLRFDHVCATACIEAGPRPVVHFNPDFVKTHCQTDQSLFMLLMHEMNHLMLGHLSLFGRMTEAKNVVFDAVINAMLCQQFPDPSYTALFSSVYSWSTFPDRLLRPPPGWPNNPEPLPKDASIKEREAHAMLYQASWEETTYGRLFELIEQEIEQSLGTANGAKGAYKKPILLGDHSGANGEGDLDHYANKDPLISNAVDDIRGRLSTQSGQGNSLYEGKGEKGEPGENFVFVLLQLIQKVQRNALIAGDRLPANYSNPVIGVIPDGRDRKRHAWKHLTGKDLILQSHHTIQPRSRSEKRRPMDVYLDVSGSMGKKVIGYSIQGLLPLVQYGFCKVYAFSTEVRPINEADMLKGRYATSYGTSLDCVFAHFFSRPKRLLPRSIVILTDLYVDEPEEKHLRKKQSLGINVGIGVIRKSFQNTDIEYLAIADVIEKIPDPN